MQSNWQSTRSARLHGRRGLAEINTGFLAQNPTRSYVTTILRLVAGAVPRKLGPVRFHPLLVAIFLFGSTSSAVATPSHPLRSLGGDLALYGRVSPLFTETDLQTPEVAAKLRTFTKPAAEAEWALANFMPERALVAIQAAEKSSSPPKEQNTLLRKYGALAYQMAGQFKQALVLLGPAASADESTQAWIDFLQKRAALADETIAPLVGALQATPADAELWAQLAEAWSDDMIYCPRNALGAAAEALAIDLQNTRAKRAEEWALAQFVQATPGRRVLARGLETGLYRNHRPELFPDTIRQRALARLEQPLENALIHWIRNVALLSALAPADQYSTAVDYARTMRQSLTDDPTFPGSYIPTFEAVLIAYSTAAPSELNDVRAAILDGFGREYFEPEIKALSWARSCSASLIDPDATKLSSAVDDLEMLCKVSRDALVTGQRRGPNWNALQPILTRLTEPKVFALITREDRLRVAEAVEKTLEQQPESVNQLAALANFHASLALAAGEADPDFKKRCDDLAMAEFFKLVDHDEVTWRQMIPAALYTFRSGRAPGAQAVADRLNEFPSVYGVITPENPIATCHAWLHAGLLHLQVQTDPKAAEARAGHCFAQAKAVLPTGSEERSLVLAAEAVLGGRPDSALRRKLIFDGTDESLQSALRHRLATLELVNAISHLAGPMPAAKSLAWTSPSIDEAAYQVRLAAAIAELKRLPPAPLWRELEKPDTGDFSRSIGAIAGIIRDVLEQRAPEAPVDVRGKASLATADPDNAKERAAFLDLAAESLEGLAFLSDAAPTPRNLTLANYNFDICNVLADAGKNLGPDGRLIGQQWTGLAGRIGLGIVRQATEARTAAYLQHGNPDFVRILDHVQSQGVVPAAQIAAVRQQYEKQRDQILAQYHAEFLAKEAAAEARRARLAAIPADPPGVISIRDDDGKVIGGLDFRESAPKPQYTYTPPPQQERPKDRPCDICHGSGVVYEVTSYSNRAATQCWRCKGKGRLPF